MLPLPAGFAMAGAVVAKVGQDEKHEFETQLPSRSMTLWISAITALGTLRRWGEGGVKLRLCAVAAAILGSSAVSQVPPPVQENDLAQARPKPDPDQLDFRTAWPDASSVTIVSYDVKSGGRPTNCHILVSSGIKSYDKIACDIIIHRINYDPEFCGYGSEARVDVHQKFRWGDRDNPYSLPETPYPKPDCSEEP
jgi:hypothetical protein